LVAQRGDYNFYVKGLGSDTLHITHQVPLTLHVISFAMTPPSPASVTVGRGTTSSPVSFQITAAGSFNQSVTVSCTPAIANALCTLMPGNTVYPTSTSPVSITATVAVPAGTSPGSYPVTLQAATVGAPSTLTTSFSLEVISHPDFILTGSTSFPEVNVGSTGTSGTFSITSQDDFTGTVNLSCPTTYGAGSCSISPSSVSSFPATATLTINGTSFNAGSYSLDISGTSGSTTHSLTVPFQVGDYSISGTQTVPLAPGGQGTASLKLNSASFYSGKINATCDATALAGAMCALSPPNPIVVNSGGTTNLTATINVPNSAIPGAYNIKIATQDTTGAPSHAFTVGVTLGQDFLVTSSTPSQSVTLGQTSGAYNLTVLPVGASFSNAVTLACSAGLPAQAQCVFSPSTPVTPGNSAVNVVMNISTTASKSAFQFRLSGALIFTPFYLLLPGIMIGWAGVGRRCARRGLHGLASIAVLILVTLSLISCGGVSNGGTKPPPVGPARYLSRDGNGYLAGNCSRCRAER
jgi:hypothetical protein